MWRFVWVFLVSRTATKLLPNRPAAGQKWHKNQVRGCPGRFRTCDRRLEDVGKPFMEVCPYLSALPDQGFCARQTPTNGYELLPQLLPNLRGRRRTKGLHGATRFGPSPMGVKPGTTSSDGSAPLSRHRSGFRARQRDGLGAGGRREHRPAHCRPTRRANRDGHG
jgi:hypothetical protein